MLPAFARRSPIDVDLAAAGAAPVAACVPVVPAAAVASGAVATLDGAETLAAPAVPGANPVPVPVMGLVPVSNTDAPALALATLDGSAAEPLVPEMLGAIAVVPNPAVGVADSKASIGDDALAIDPVPLAKPEEAALDKAASAAAPKPPAAPAPPNWLASGAARKEPAAPRASAPVPAAAPAVKASKAP